MFLFCFLKKLLAKRSQIWTKKHLCHDFIIMEKNCAGIVSLYLSWKCFSKFFSCIVISLILYLKCLSTPSAFLIIYGSEQKCRISSNFFVFYFQRATISRGLHINGNNLKQMAESVFIADLETVLLTSEHPRWGDLTWYLLCFIMLFISLHRCDTKTLNDAKFIKNNMNNIILPV